MYVYLLYPFRLSTGITMKIRKKTADDSVSALDALYRRPGFLLRRANQIAEGVFVNEFAAFDLTPAQCGTLIVAQACPGLDQSAIALAMGFDRATMGQILRNLESRGLLVREASEMDARRRHIFITAAAAELLRNAKVALERAQERLLAPYSPAEREQLLALLQRMCDTFNAETRSPLARPELEAAEPADAASAT
jgi:DNA-binding MarR family transcriptional regulator